MLTLYPDNVGFQSIIYFAALRGDLEQIAAFNIMMNVSSIIFLTGIAFSIICRTQTKILIGNGDHHAAKHYFTFSALISTVAGLIGGSIIYAGRHILASMFASTTAGTSFWYTR